MNVKNVNFLLDGGSAHIDTDAGMFILDRSLMSKKRNALYLVQADKSRQEVEDKKAELSSALELFLLESPDAIFPEAIKKVIEDLS